MFPYKPLVAIPIACITIALLFFHIAAFSCKTFSFDTDTAAGIVKGGFWTFDASSFTADKGCVRYDRETGIDRVIQWGRAVGITGAVVAWPVLLAALCLLVRTVSWWNRMLLAYACLFLAMLSFFLLSGQASGKELKQGPGGTLAILAALLWVVAAGTLLKCVKERESDGEGESTKRDIAAGDAAKSSGEDEDGGSSNQKRGWMAALGLGGAAAAASGAAASGKKKKSRAKTDGNDEEKDVDVEENDKEVSSNEKSTGSSGKRAGAAGGLGLAGLFAGSRRKKNQADESHDKDIELGGTDGDAGNEDADAVVDGNQGDADPAKSSKKRGVLAGMGLAGLAAGSARSRKGAARTSKKGQEGDTQSYKDSGAVESEPRDLMADNADEKATQGDDDIAGATDDDDNGEGDEKSGKVKKRGMLAGMGLAGFAAGSGAGAGTRNRKKERGIEKDEEESASNDVAGDEVTEDVNGQSGKTKKRGVMAGLGMAGLAAGAGSRSKKDTNQADNDDEDNIDEGNKSSRAKEKRGAFAGRRKKRPKNDAQDDEAIDSGGNVDEDDVPESVADNPNDDEREPKSKSERKTKKKRGAFSGRAASLKNRATNGDENEEVMDAGEDQNGDDCDDEDKSAKGKKRGILSGVGLAAMASGAGARRIGKAHKASGDEEEVDENLEDEEQGPRDIDEVDADNGETGSEGGKSRGGVLGGMGLAGLAAAGSRKSRKNSTTKDDSVVNMDQEEDANPSPRKNSFFAGFNRKSQQGEDDEVEGAFPTSPSSAVEDADKQQDIEARNLSAIDEEDSKADEEDQDVDSKKKGNPNKFLALLGVGGAAAAGAATSTSRDEGKAPGDKELPTAVTGLSENQASKGVQLSSTTEASPSVAGATESAAVGQVQAVVGMDPIAVTSANDDDLLSPTDDENEALEQQADESFDKALGEQKKKGGLLKMLSRKSADEVVEISETMAVETGPDGRKMRTLTTTTVMSSGAKTIKSRVEPVG